jgi:Integrase core domain
MDLEDAGSRARFLIRDRDGRFPGLFDDVLTDAGIKIVLSGVQMPRMNSIMERWVQTCRRELLDRTLIWNQRHLLHALREFEQFYNGHRPHQGIANARPLCPLPTPIGDPDEIAPSQNTKTRPPGRHSPRVRACRVTCMDEALGKGNVLVLPDGPGPASETRRCTRGTSSPRRDSSPSQRTDGSTDHATCRCSIRAAGGQASACRRNPRCRGSGPSRSWGPFRVVSGRCCARWRGLAPIGACR